MQDVDGNPFQPDIIYRGFIASPVAGTPQGLAVYVNGARFNDPFGDTVNWDLIPAVAIQSVTVQSSNPLFGLNALGGSVSVQLKNGFTFQGGDFSTYAGSYGRLGSSLEYGKQVGDFAVYGSGEFIHDGGFQPTGYSQIERGFLDLGWRGPTSELHLDITGANNWLGNPGASPVQALQANLGNIFTAPNTVYNQYFGLNLHGTYAIDPKMSVQGVAYFHNLDQRVPERSHRSTWAPCNDGSGFICNGDGSYVTGAGGTPITDLWSGGPYSGLSRPNPERPRLWRLAAADRRQRTRRAAQSSGRRREVLTGRTAFSPAKRSLAASIRIPGSFSRPALSRFSRRKGSIRSRFRTSISTTGYSVRTSGPCSRSWI